MRIIFLTPKMSIISKIINFKCTHTHSIIIAIVSTYYCFLSQIASFTNATIKIIIATTLSLLSIETNNYNARNILVQYGQD